MNILAVEETASIWPRIIDSGLSQALLALAVVWFSRRLGEVEKHVVECNEDRERLWERIAKMAAGGTTQEPLSLSKK